MARRRSRDSLSRLADLSMCKRLGWRHYLFLRRCHRYGYRFKYCIERGGTVTPRPASDIVFFHEWWVARADGPTGVWCWLWVTLGRWSSLAYHHGRSRTKAARFGDEY